jgi:hypothetical protein
MEKKSSLSWKIGVCIGFLFSLSLSLQPVVSLERASEAFLRP